MNHKNLTLLLVPLAAAAVVGLVYLRVRPSSPVVPVPTTPLAAEPAGDVTLTYAVQWQEQFRFDGMYEDGVLKAKGLNQYMEEYSQLHPNIHFKIEKIPQSDYAATLQLMNDTGTAPDIYQVYSTWGVELQKNGVLDNPPSDIKDDVRLNYVSVAGVTIDDDIWGIPTEVNDYALIYNKEIFKRAGLVDARGEAVPPATWTELLADAEKTTVRDAQGNITQYGFAFRTNNYGSVGGPILSLLFSNDGEYLSEGNQKCLLDSPAGIETLTAVQQLFKQGSSDINGNYWDFGKKTVAMAIVAPWTEGTFRSSLGSDFDKIVGVAPVPYLKKPASLQYSWFMGVMNQSTHKQAAWDFLRWFALEQQEETGTTRYGDFLAKNISVIPSRREDQVNSGPLLATPFKKVFLEGLPLSVAEPNVLQSVKIGDALMSEIQSTWTGLKTPTQAAHDACTQIDKLLIERQARP